MPQPVENPFGPTPKLSDTKVDPFAEAPKAVEAAETVEAVETVQPALASFYSSLSDDQKARFDGMGRQLFAQNQQ